MKMPKLAMPLTVFKIQNAKPKAKKTHPFSNGLGFNFEI